MKRQHLCMMAVGLIMAICMCFGLAACNSDSGEGTHTHSYGNWMVDPDDDTKHVGTCISTVGVCDTPTKTEGHEYVDGECVCGAKDPDAPVTHYHDYDYTDNDDGTHSAVCNGAGECTEPIENVEHVYDQADNKCVCGAKESVTPVTHNHDYDYTDNDDGTHSAVCNGAGECTEPIENVEHVYDQADNKCVCGATEPVTPEPEVTLAEPAFTIDRNGNVTVAKHQHTEIFKYVIGAPEDLEAAYVDETIATLATNVVSGELKLESGQAIAILAGGYTAENGTIYKDSPCTEPVTYKAPAGAFDAIDAEDVEISLGTTGGKVDVVWLHDGTTFEIVLNGVEQTLNDSEIALDFTTYTEIKIKALATEPEEGYDYSNCKNESGYLDITAAFNTFVANEKIKVEEAALTLDTNVQENKEITLPTAGATYTDVTIAWSVKGGNTSIASVDGGKLTITPTATETTVTVIAKLTCGTVTTPVEKELTVTVKLLEVASETFTFSSANNVTGAIVSIDFAKGTNTNNAPAYNTGDFNSTGSVRVYAKNTITVNGNGKKITKIIITYMQDTDDNKVTANIGTYTQNITGNGTATNPLVGTWVGEEESVVFTIGGSSKHIKVKSIEVTYEKPSDEDIVNAALKAMESFSFADKYADNFLVDATVNGLDVSWSANPNTGHGSISFTQTPENGKYTAIIDPSTESDKEVTLTASVTSGEVTKTKTFTVTLARKVPATIAAPNVKVGEDGKATWTAVANAESYVYQLKTADANWTDGTETIAYNAETGLYSVPSALTDGQSIRVKAVGDGYNYSESAWTEKTYVVGNPPHEHDYTYTDNKDGTHSAVCNGTGECDESIENVKHVYDQADNKCVCGAVESNDPDGKFDFNGMSGSGSATATASDFTDNYTGTNTPTISGSITKVFKDSDRIKFGNSNTAGTVTITFGSDIKVKKVVLNCIAYEAGASLSITNATTTDTIAAKGTAPADMTFTFASPTNSITITSTKRAYVYSIEIYFE